MSAARILWKICRRLSRRKAVTLMHAAADVITLLNPESVKQLRRNHERLAGRKLSRREIRAAVRSYYRMFAEEFTLANWDKDYLRGACIYPQAAEIAEELEAGPVILALTHSGNWDQAGAWFCQEHGKILTVAERLDDPQLLQEFVELRKAIGLEILTVGQDEHIFDQLVERIANRPLLVPLLADRDISGAGIRVQLAGHEALVAAGPAALALKLNRPLIAGHIAYEKAGKDWKIRAHFTDPIAPPTPQTGETAVEALTREWVRLLEPTLVEHLTDWHMMQKVFVEDLDPARLARAEKRHEQQMKAGDQ